MRDPVQRPVIEFSLSLFFFPSLHPVPCYYSPCPILLREARTAPVSPPRDLLEFRRRRFAVRLLLSSASSPADSPFDELLLWFEIPASFNMPARAKQSASGSAMRFRLYRRVAGRSTVNEMISRLEITVPGNFYPRRMTDKWLLFSFFFFLFN